MPIDEALRRHLMQLRANGRSEHTVLQVKRHIRLLICWLEHEGRLTELVAVDEETLAGFLTSAAAMRSARGGAKKPGSMNALRSSVKSFFASATRAGWLASDPALFIKRAICSPPPPRALTATEQGRFFATLDAAQGAVAERDRMLFKFMLGTGARLSSALAIEVGDVDIEERTVLLRTMKGCDVQRVFMPERTAAELERFLVGMRGGPVFARIDGKALSARHAQRRFRLWREQAGLPDSVTPHSLRHAFAMGVYARTGDLLLVKAALRHRSITSTLIYARVDDDRVRSALEAPSDKEFRPASI